MTPIMWRHLPNLITILRIALVLPLFWLIVEQRYGSALLVAGLAGVSDAADGYLARRFDWRSRLGGLLDPIADKLLLIASFLALTLVGGLPAWLLALVVVRDLVIVAGAVAYHYLIGPFAASPSLLSKATTLVQILCVLAELLHLSGLAEPPLLAALIGLTAVLTVLSGVHYVVVWTARAARPSNGGKR